VTQRALFPRRVTHEELNSLVDKAAADCKFILVLLFLKSLEIFLEWLFFELTCLNPARFHLADAAPGLKRELVCSLKMPLPPFLNNEKSLTSFQPLMKSSKLKEVEKQNWRESSMA